MLVPQSFAIVIFLKRKRILLYFSHCFGDKNLLISSKRSHIILCFPVKT